MTPQEHASRLLVEDQIRRGLLPPVDEPQATPLEAALDSWADLFGSPVCIVLFGILWALLVIVAVGLTYFAVTAP